MDSRFRGKDEKEKVDFESTPLEPSASSILPGRANLRTTGINFVIPAFIVGSDVSDLLLYMAMIASLFTIGIWWHVIQTYPGLLESLGYLYGMLVASFSLDALEAYMESDIE